MTWKIRRLFVIGFGCAYLGAAQAAARADDGTSDAGDGSEKKTIVAKAGAPAHPPTEAQPDAGSEEQRGQIAESQKSPRGFFPLKFGMESYQGISNLGGRRRMNDGMWAGSSAGYPSVAFLRWENGGHGARVAIGTGAMYNETGSSLDQPAEAWFQFPAGKTSITVGKYWVPFAAQEWQYETKPGVMAQWSQGPTSLSFSSNYNVNVRSMNSYARVGQEFGEDAGIGLSLAHGRGLTFDSGHDRAWGVDATFAAGGFRFYGEYMGALEGAGSAFSFLFGRVEFERMGLWKPFAGFYQWNDRGGTFGRYRSSVYGMAYQVTPTLALESAIAPTSDRQISWLQLHWTWER